jgi:flagellar L-ring protein precursor FlgH
MSLFAVTAPPPRKYGKHDLVEVIVNESSVQNLAQVVDTKKDYNLTAELSKFPSLKSLIESATLEEGIGSVHPALGLKSGNKFKGDSKFNRKDQVTAKITATVVDVKPNGTLVLEARESIQTDKEITTMVLSGVCREEDITKGNTVQSSQLAALTMKIEHEGDVKDNAVKGVIPRIIEAIFNF